MNPTEPNGRTPLTDSALERIDSICDRFEQAWRTGTRPRLRDFLDGEGDERARLLSELMRIDLEYRRRSGEQAQSDDYAAEFAQELGSVTQPVPANDAAAAGDVSETLSSHPVRQPKSLFAGKFKLLEQVGEGGMGTVWVAEQIHPVRRKVALKLIKPGMDSRQVLARFDAERQALALMDHPNIAKVYDGGLTEDQRPYFVMEYVKGVPLTDYCDNARLTVPERLKLFGQVCQAVQHAHQKGIIHRDLKPSNILVCLYDGQPVPKVIDFGLAKAMHQPLTEHTLHTAHGMMVGTPLYMSPEQAELNNLDVDTRTDIYSLGVILYELLTGATPLERAQLKAAAYGEILRLIKEEEPLKPSLKLSSSASLPSVAAQRRVEPAQLSRAVRGDLDWIVMKALEKERSRRYETANGLARDIERYLRNEPVEAGPPTASYRLKKFAQRNKGPMIAASLVLLALVGGIIGTTAGLMEAKRQEALAIAARDEKEQARVAEAKQRVRAETSQKQANAEKVRAQQAAVAEQAANEQTQKRLIQIEKANRILGSIFEDLNPLAEEQQGKPLQTLLGERLDQATAELEGDAIGDPLAVARMQLTLGMSQRGLGYPDKAIGLLGKARLTFTDQLGPDHADTLASMNGLAESYRDAGKLDLALPLYQETLKLRKATLGPNHTDTLTSMSGLAMSYHDAGMLELALPLYEEALKLGKVALGAEHPHTLASMNNLATGYGAAGKLNLSLSLLEETLKLKKAKLGAQHPNTLNSMSNLAAGYHAAGKLDLALPLLEETLKLRKAKLGPDHPDTLTSMNNLAVGYGAAGKLDLSLPLLEETFKLNKAKLGPDHPDTLTSKNNLLESYRDAGKLDLAVPLHEETVNLAKAKYGLDHPFTQYHMDNLAGSYRDVGKYDAALALLRDLWDARRRVQGASNPQTVDTENQLGACLLEQGKFEEAETHLRASQALCDTDSGFTPTHAEMYQSRLVDLYSRWGKQVELSHWRAAWATTKRTALPTSPEARALGLYRMGVSLMKWNGYEEAEDAFREALTIREEKRPDNWTTFNARSHLGWALLEQKRYDEAEPLLLNGYEGLKERKDKITRAANVRQLPDALDRLVRLYDAWDKPEEATKWRMLQTHE